LLVVYKKEIEVVKDGKKEESEAIVLCQNVLSVTYQRYSEATIVTPTEAFQINDDALIAVLP